MPVSQANQEHFRIGVDLGGSKIEFVALERDGKELHRHRIATPRFDYDATVRAVADAVQEIEKKLGRSATVGMGIPGTISTRTGFVKNANSTWLNGKPFDKDLGRALAREVRCANDANCLAVSEATDGAGAGKHVVFAVILGTGCGGGIAARRRRGGGVAEGGRRRRFFRPDAGAQGGGAGPHASGPCRGNSPPFCFCEFAPKKAPAGQEKDRRGRIMKHTVGAIQFWPAAL